MYTNFLGIIIIVFFLTQLSSISNAKQEGNELKKQYPIGESVLSLGLDCLPNSENIPVKITHVLETQKILSISEIELNNYSNKNITSVNMLWIVTKQEDKNTLVCYQEVPFINLASGLLPNSKLTVSMDDFFFMFLCSFSSFSRNNSIIYSHSNYEVVLVIAKVGFEDGSIWERDFGPLVFSKHNRLGFNH